MTYLVVCVAILTLIFWPPAVPYIAWDSVKWVIKKQKENENV